MARARKAPTEGFPELLDVKDVAVLLGVSAKTVYELIWRDEIECYRFRRRYRFSREQVLAFLDASRGGGAV